MLEEKRARRGEGTARRKAARGPEREVHPHERLSLAVERALLDPTLPVNDWGVLLSETAAELERVRGGLPHDVLRSWLFEALSRARAKWWKLFALPVEGLGLNWKMNARLTDVPDVLERRAKRLDGLLVDDRAIAATATAAAQQAAVRRAENNLQPLVTSEPLKNGSVGSGFEFIIGQGRRFDLTGRQRQVVRRLYTAWKLGGDGTPVSKDSLEVAIERGDVRVPRYFEGSDALETIVCRHPTVPGAWALYLHGPAPQ